MIEYIHRLKFKKSSNLQKCLWIYFLLAIYCWVCSLPLRAVFFFHSETSLEKTKLSFANGYLFLPIFSLILLSFSSPHLILHSSIPCQNQNIYSISHLYRDLCVPPVPYSTSNYCGSKDCLNNWYAHICKHIPYCIAS